MTFVDVLFLLLGGISVGAGLLVVTSRNVVHAALWLVLCLGTLAGCYLLLTAEFVALVQILIYVGAVVVLLLFALMLTRAPTAASMDLSTRNAPLAALVAVATAAVLVVTVVAGFAGEAIELSDVEVGGPSAIGTALFSTWVLPFEVLSVLLLAALIGAIVLSRGGGAAADDGAADEGAADEGAADEGTGVDSEDGRSVAGGR